MTEKTSHDQNFKNLILDYPQQALAFFAPQEAPSESENITITPVRQEQLKQRLSDRFHELDVPLLVTWPDGRREALLFVLEEETQPSRFSIHRLAVYCIELAELFRIDRVVPVVIFLRRSRKTPKSLQLGGEHHCYLNFQYLCCDLSRLSPEDYWDSPNLVARLNLSNMNLSQYDRVTVYAQAVRALLDLEPDNDKRIKYLDFIDIYSALTENEQQEYQTRYPKERAAMSRFAERFLKEGREEGRKEGVLSLLKNLLQHRFGPLDELSQQRLEKATLEELELWADNLLEARTLEEVFRE
ncbi:MAG: hypothetical protein R3296_07740 [Oleiphilaceae bacterium]|nr:hypothetical protein [Oleiphilaceae bacterium]